MTWSWWVLLYREHHQDAAVGPYPTEDDATKAMTFSLLIDSLCEEDCTDCVVVELIDYPPDVDVHVIDMNDPNHTGRRTA